MTREYYQGTIGHHAAFWVKYRDFPAGERFDAFVSFFKQVEQEVKQGKCSLRNAGYALRPVFYDNDVYSEHEADLTFVDDAVEDLIIEAATDQEAAEQIWDYIVRFMELAL
jgi:hypothetical protein